MASPSLPQPPPYAEEESFPNIESQKHFRVNRKPVPGQVKVHIAAGDGEGISNNSHSEDAVYADDHKPPLPTRPELSVETTVTPRLESFASASTSTDLSSIRSVPVSNISSTTSPASSKSSASLHIQNAYREARHFAGGLITHPFESTKHFTILRHSHGLVFYKGSSTSLAISIFADAPLPPDRTLWLQSKGWTGKTGMRAKALIGRNGSWLNVTPTIEVTTEQLDPNDERAWQRDITSFRKKAQSKIRENHALRETAVVRIPVEAEDGYFQIVLCMGDKKKVLCPSPVFRILSTSRSPSSIRGASLKSLPLELGALALGTYASNTVGRVISPVTSTVQSSVEQYMPSWKTRQAAMAAYDMSGVEDKVNTTLNDANGQYDQALQQSFTTASGDQIILEQGPEMPYPIRFFGRGQITHSTEVDQSSLPVCTLSGVESNVLHRFYGHYFGWARRFEKSRTKTIDYPWHQVAISVLPLDHSQLTHVNVALTSKRTVTIRLITEETNIELDQIQFEILVMGFIRTDDPKQRANLTRGLQAGDEAAAEAAILSEVQDVSIVQSYLDHPSWSAQAISRPKGQAEKTNALEKAKMTYANTRIAAQNRIDRIPLHKLGIRAPTDSMRDKMVITNGFFVPRGKQFNESIMN